MIETQQFHETFYGGMVPTLPDRRPQTPDDLPAARELGECPRCGAEHFAEYPDQEGILTTPCASCGEALCTECQQETCDIGDHSVCRACIRKLSPESGLACCLKCSGNVLEGPLGEIYQMKRAMESAHKAIALLIDLTGAWDGTYETAPAIIGRSAAMATGADVSLRVALRTAKERGY